MSDRKLFDGIVFEKSLKMPYQTSCWTDFSINWFFSELPQTRLLHEKIQKKSLLNGKICNNENARCTQNKTKRKLFKTNFQFYEWQKMVRSTLAVNTMYQKFHMNRIFLKNHCRFYASNDRIENKHSSSECFFFPHLDAERIASIFQNLSIINFYAQFHFDCIVFEFPYDEHIALWMDWRVNFIEKMQKVVWLAWNSLLCQLKEQV